MKRQYSSFEDFYPPSAKDKFICVQKRNKWGVISTNGDILVPFIYKELFPLHQEDALENTTFIATKDSDKEIIINCYNKQLSKQEFDYIDRKSNVLFPVKLGDKSGAIDWFGNLKIEIGKYNIGIFLRKEKDGDEVYGYFDEWRDDDLYYGLIDSRGEIVIPCEYNTTPCFLSKNYIAIGKDGKYGIIDWKNNVIVDFEFDMLVAEDDVVYGSINQKIVFFDKECKPILLK